MWVDTRKIHVFDPASGENLTRDPGDTAHAGAGAATTPI
jgi:hypothetical protein